MQRPLRVVEEVPLAERGVEPWVTHGAKDH